MKQQHTQSSFGQGDWDRERNRNEADPRTGANSPEQGRPYPQSGPSGYPESHYQQQAQRDHPGTEYFSGSAGYGGRGDSPQQQQGQGSYGQQQGGHGSSQQGPNYGGGSWSRSESEVGGQGGNRQQEAYQPGPRHQPYGSSEDFGRSGYGDREREERAHLSGGHQFGSGQQQYGQGQPRESQHSQYGRGEFDEEPFRQGSRQQSMGYGETGRWTSGYEQSAGGRRDQPQGGQFQDSRMIDQQAQGYGQGYGMGQQRGQSLDQGRFQQEQFHGYGGRMSGQSQAGQSSQFGGHYGEPGGGQQSQGYGGFQTGQPQSYGNAEGGQFFARGGHNTAEQPSGGYGSYGAYQVGSQPQHTRRSTPRPPRDYSRSDERIRELICEDLAHHHSIDASDVSVQVKDGRVSLEGTVPDRQMKHEIEDVADHCWGVKDVENRIRVQQNQGGMPSHLNNPAEGFGSAVADVMTGSASTEATMKTSPTDMSPEETGSGETTGAGGSSTTIASGRQAGAESSKTKGK